MKKINVPSNAKLTKGLYIFLMLLMATLSSFSQNVGINATGAAPNANAGLDVDFSDKGMLIPRVALTGTSNFAPLAAHVAGMIVYNTANAGDVTPGFYYNNGTRWVASMPRGTSMGDMLYWNGSAWVRLPAGTAGQFLQFSPSSIPVWTGSAFIDLTTTAASAITATSANSGGTIVNLNGSIILTRGVCYATTTSPNISSSTVTGGATSPFTCALPSLTAGTIYYVRAYATSNSLTSYGNQVTFSTLATVTTTAGSLITTNTARTGGSVTSGNAPVIERGVCYGLTTNPTIANNPTVYLPAGTGSFVSDLSGLTENTLYYVRAYATNAGGIAYATQVTITTAPTLTTAVVTGITQTAATSGGNIAFGGGASITAKGVCWSTSPAPTTALSTKTNNGAGTGVFSSSLTGLQGGTLYYLRAYATNAGGTYYGNEISFTTSAPIPPTVASTAAISGISANGATSGGSITSDGGAPVTARGVCWSTSPTPVLGSGNVATSGTGTGTYTSTIAGLTGNTTYYVRAYATNSAGTAYGPVDVSFTTWVQAAYTVGQNLGYGYCCYVNPQGGGLIVSYDIPSTIGWGCPGVNIGTSAAIGFGQSNTNLILAACATRPIAASIADEYSVTHNGVTYSDWYLPSSNEWGTMSSQYYMYGLGYGNSNYYTSTEYGSPYTHASTYFYTGSQAYSNGAQRVPGTNDRIYALRVMRTFYGATPPTVTTEPTVTNIGVNTATSGGNVTNEGGATATRGVCWSTSPNPTIANSKTTDGTGLGSFVSSIASLTPSTLYYVRAYATNIAGTSYGSQVSFTTTAPTAPIITTAPITSPSPTSCTSGGTITSDGGSPITVSGICWGTSAGPLVTGTKTTDGTLSGTFASIATGLTTGTQYFIRAYATNGAGTSYGNELTFTPVNFATITTDAITNITATTATSGGNITNNGGSTVTVSGICWSTTSPPTTADAITTDGSALGSFVSNLSALATGTPYYVRAYATNGAGTAYGNEQTFTPSGPGIPTVTTDVITNPTSTGGTSGGNVTSDGGATVTARGVCWSNTNFPPTILDPKTSDGTGTGAFTSTITGLTAGFGYWFRAYATNSYGTAYGIDEYYVPVTLPTVTTLALNYTSPATTGTSGVSVSSDGGDPLTALGIVWGTSANPTVSTNLGITTENLGFGWYQSSTLTGLVQSTTYYVRAYATNGQGTSYGAEISFTPGVAGLPTTTTGIVANKIGSIAEIGTEILADGGDLVLTSGICWSTSANPTVTTNLGMTIEYVSLGLNYSFASNLTLGTTYHVRAYATNGIGTTYGTDVSFVATAATNGQVIQGGWLNGSVFMVDGTGLHGLLAQSYSNQTGTDWGCPDALVGTTGTGIGTGTQNSTDIINDNTLNGCTSGVAPSFIFASEWCTFYGTSFFLPSKDEFNLMWADRMTNGLNPGFESAVPSTFWSSSEVDATHAWSFDSTTGTWSSELKTAAHNFWAIRSF